MIATWVLSFVLILARVATFVVFLPLFGGPNVPRLVKIGLAMALAMFWFTASDLPADSSVVDVAQLNAVACCVALAREAIVGAVLGYGLGLFLVPARIAGEFFGQEMGLSMGMQADPLAPNGSQAVTQVFEMLAMLLFLALDGHHLFLAALHSTFTRWQLGGGAGLPVARLVDGAATSQEWGLLLAAPLALCLFLTTVILAMMARTAPQMHMFSFGFAVRIVIGLGAAALLLPDLGATLIRIFGRTAELVPL